MHNLLAPKKNPRQCTNFSATSSKESICRNAMRIETHISKIGIRTCTVQLRAFTTSKFSALVLWGLPSSCRRIRLQDVQILTDVTGKLIRGSTYRIQTRGKPPSQLLVSQPWL